MGSLILGSGYILSLVICYTLGSGWLKKYYSLKNYDKFFINLFIGTFLFIIATNAIGFNFQSITNENILMQELFTKITRIIAYEVIVILLLSYCLLLSISMWKDLKKIYNKYLKKNPKRKEKTRQQVS